MDKGFNDDELADIMNEIESLEKDFHDEVEDVVMEKLAETPEPEVKPVEDKNVHHIPKPVENNAKHENSMNFSVQGDMKLNLTFDIDGKSIALNINDGAFEIEVDGGMKFSIPTNSDQIKKSA